MILDTYLAQLQEFTWFEPISSYSDKKIYPGKIYKIKVKNKPVELYYHPSIHKPTGKVCKIDSKKFEYKLNQIYEKISVYLYKQLKKEMESKVTYNEFKRKVEIYKILVLTDCSCEVSFDDGDIYGDHELIVMLNKNFIPYKIQVEG